ncbi:MAG: TonB-dependent receptor, partial [Bacteroidales bacterium]|nr:TonB-dependent receptor [Bacteroidales bacterium]
MRQFFILVVFSICSVASLMAQNISGKVVDEKNAPIVGANVLLLSKADSTFLAGTTTSEDGDFALANREDAGTLIFSFIGYHSVYHTLDGNENIGIIKMQVDEHLLDEVTVVGSRII